MLEKLRHLPTEKRAEVVDFIDFLLVRDQGEGVRLVEWDNEHLEHCYRYPPLV